MEKIKIDILKRPDITIFQFGKNISINPIIKISEQKELRDMYLISMLNKGETTEFDETFAEYMLRVEILRLKTNIDISASDFENAEELVWGDFYEKVVSQIVNYVDFRKSLSIAIENRVKLISIKNSSGYILKGLIEKINPIIETFSNMSQEDLSGLKETMMQMVNEIKSSPVSSVLDDASKSEKPKRNRKAK